MRLAEQNDLGSSTSSASTKLFHGGLRYLEYYRFRLVRESLIERDLTQRHAPTLAGQCVFITFTSKNALSVVNTVGFIYL